MAPLIKVHGEPAEGNKTGGSVGRGDTNLISPVAWLPQCSMDTHLWACKTHSLPFFLGDVIGRGV